MPVVEAPQWSEFLTSQPNAHVLQTTAWGELKSAFGWDVVRLVTGRAGGQILFRRLPFGLRLAYLPKGPVGVSYTSGSPGQGKWDELWDEIDHLCRRRGAFFIKVEPDQFEEEGTAKIASPPPGFQTSSHTIQPPRTLIVDLRGNDDLILGRMKQKTRYNIRLALKKDVIVRATSDLETFHQLLLSTARRDQFSAHSLEYYQRAYDLFAPLNQCQLLQAEVEGVAVAALMAFCHGQRAWYFYGASSDLHRDRMPTYLLQWEAMRWARSQGCTQYDLWGVPDHNEAELEAGFERQMGGLWGVYRFKRGFGGKLVRSLGPWDRVYQPLLYKLYLIWANRRGLGEGSPG